MESDMSFLPDDIMVNILKSLPVKSLIRSQCVCKHWKNLIKKSSFIAEHLHHSSHQSPSLLLRWPSFTSSDYRWGLLDCDMQELIVQGSSLIDSLSRLRLCGSSNGFLCLKSETRETNSNCLHFGVNRRSVFRVKVFLFRTRLWKEVEFGNLKGLFVVDDPVSVNGHVFWLVFKPCVDDRNCRVVSFDIANKVFSLIPMPAEDDSVEMQSQVLTVHENNLAMLWVKFATEDIYCIKLWVMDEGSRTFGERWSWTNTYYSGHCYTLCPLTIWGNEIICEPEFYDESEDDPYGSLPKHYYKNAKKRPK
ncbi:hypothetical protein K1719_024433 [Acacia pycnantha]|nr:hypothetical protein K1719_024433 [Acacia pycnantha]